MKIKIREESVDIDTPHGLVSVSTDNDTILATFYREYEEKFIGNGVRVITSKFKPKVFVLWEGK